MAERTRRKPAGKPPITSHPLFPVLVVLWFGALFGLASLAIHPASLEGIVLATGIDQVIPKAAPPLGTTTRILIALMMTGLGCLAGLLVARRFRTPAQEPAPRRRRAAADTETVSPVAMFGAAREDAADENAAAQPPLRRRQLAILREEDDFADHAPLPGKTQILQVSDLELDSFDAEQEAWLRSTERRHVPLDEVIEDPVDESHDPAPAPQEPVTERLDAFREVAHEMAADRAEPEPEPEPDDHKRSNRLFEAYVHRVNAGVGSNDSELPAPGFVSLPRLDGEDAALTAPEPAAAEPATAPEPIEANEPKADPEDAPYANTAERIATAPLDELSHVELLERLGQTIARRRAERNRAEPEPAQTETPADMPAALRPLAPEDSADDELPGYVPPRHIGMKPVADADDDALAQGYSSLRDMTRPAAGIGSVPQATDAPAPPPVFAFPGRKDAPAGDATPRAFDAPRTTDAQPDATEQALRAALDTLRRMSGAA